MVRHLDLSIIFPGFYGIGSYLFLIFISLVIYIPNPGGIGFSLPFNVLTYGGAAL